MGLQRIDELTAPPAVGQRYLVPTVRYEWQGMEANWPVIGPKHTDAEHLKFPHEHFHVDGRFVAPSTWTALDDAELLIARQPLCRRKDWHPLTGMVPHPAPVLRPRTCHRISYCYPHAEVTQHPNFKALLKAYATDRLRGEPGAWICPHKGAPLGSMVPDADGVITCPLHGLRWCNRTGESRP